jgi:hypothetical protein
MSWTSAVRPSRRPLSRPPQDEEFLNAINNIPHAEERPQSLPQARTGGASRSTQSADAILNSAVGDFLTASFASVTSFFVTICRNVTAAGSED